MELLKISKEYIKLKFLVLIFYLKVKVSVDRNLLIENVGRI